MALLPILGGQGGASPPRGSRHRKEPPPPQTMADEGTSLESLESGDVANQADADRMAAILRDMNASAEREPMPSMVPRMPMPSSDMGLPPPPSPPVYAAEDHPPGPPAKRRGNFFNSVFERIKEPLLVAALMFFLSLPVFHASAAKVVPWAFAIGGELSYLGLIVKSLFAGGLFAVAQFGLAFL